MIHNIAHRGASAYEPENTLRAFDRAIEMGATMLELDVHLSQDDRLVVIHDGDMSRISGDPTPIREMTVSQIQRFDAGQAGADPIRGNRPGAGKGRAVH